MLIDICNPVVNTGETWQVRAQEGEKILGGFYRNAKNFMWERSALDFAICCSE